MWNSIMNAACAVQREQILICTTALCYERYYIYCAAMSLSASEQAYEMIVYSVLCFLIF
jgi:hypothetical protein